MFRFFQKKQTLVRVLMGLVIGVIGLMMVVTLVPGPVGSVGDRPDTVASVGGQDITVNDVNRALARIEANGRNIPRQLRALYARQVVDQLIYERMLEFEAKRMGIRVTDEERAEQIKRMMPDAFVGGAVASMEGYAVAVQQRFQMTVPEFEELLRKSLLEQKFRRLVTDGISVAPSEVEEEFRRKNEKVKIEYALLKPSEFETKVNVTEADLASFFERSKAKYQLPERRSLRYALLDINQLRQSIRPSEAELRAYYDLHMDRYRLQNRAHVSRILFKTLGKTDAEIEEVRTKAGDVVAKLKKGAKFEDLAKQYSEDAAKDKGGDLGWIVPGQTVAEFERTAFSLKPGETSDLVKTPIGFEIIRVIERETARTQSFEEVRASLLPEVVAQMADQKATEVVDKIAAAVRQSNRQPLDSLAKQFSMTLVELPPVTFTDPLGELGNAPEVRDSVFRGAPGELSPPLRTDRGFVVVAVKEIQPSRQATLADVRGKVETDFRAEKAVELVRQHAQELAQKAKSGTALSEAAQALALEVKTSEPIARPDSVPEVGSARRLAPAFTLPVGETAPALFLGSNWVVYRVLERQAANPDDFGKQRQEIEQQLLQSKQQLAYEAFRATLKERLKNEGKLRVNEEALRRLSTVS